VELLTRTRSLLQLAKLQKQLKQTVGQVRKLQG
jgi:hypothetical protein